MYKYLFGDNLLCGDWCSYCENFDMNYKLLLYGKCLFDLNLQRFLLDIFGGYKSICKKLVYMGLI